VSFGVSKLGKSLSRKSEIAAALNVGVIKPIRSTFSNDFSTRIVQRLCE